MLDMLGVLKNIKSVLRLHSGLKKIYDKEVATVLNITQTKLAIAKKRDSLLFKEILTWCHETGVDADFIFFGTKTEV